MDKRSITGLVIISIIVMGWLFYQSVYQQQPEFDPNATDISQKIQQDSTDIPDEIATENEMQSDTSDALVPATDTSSAIEKYGQSFAEVANGDERIITVENEILTAKISTKGGTVTQWQLKEYDKWDGAPTDLIWNEGGELYMIFVTMENKRIDTRDIYFELESKEDYYKVSKGNKLELKLYVEPEPGRKIHKTIVFYGDKYHIEHDITLENIGTIIPKRGYDLVWANGLRYQEENSSDESSEAMSVISMNGEIEEVDATDEDEPEEESFTGIIDYAAVKIKYFMAAIIPQPWQSYDGTIDVFGEKDLTPNKGQVEKYTVSFRVPYNGGVQQDKFKVYIGPLDYDIVKDYGLKATVNFGWRILIRPIGEYFMMPIFKFIHTFISNYGVAIIIFSILMKLLLYPLSIQQMRSSQKMKLLQPEMEKIREKYKDDNTKQQQETMKLYQMYGINPAGGCLPLLAQMPILFALWSVLRTNIDLRQAEFFWYIKDLSTPDTVIEFGFSILGMDSLSGLALLMGATMFLQQKMTITDPRQKMLVYLMPLIFVFLFSNFPAGLNLYYFMFNLLGIVQQVYINKFSKNRPTLDDLKKAPKKEGWLQKKMREAQEMAESQGRSVPGQKYQGKQKSSQTRKKKKK